MADRPDTLRPRTGRRLPDVRPLLDEAAAIGARYGSAGLLVGEMLAAGLTYGRQLWFRRRAERRRPSGRHRR